MEELFLSTKIRHVHEIVRGGRCSKLDKTMKAFIQTAPMDKAAHCNEVQSVVSSLPSLSSLSKKATILSYCRLSFKESSLPTFFPS